MTSPRLQDYSRLVDYPVQRKLLSLLDGYHRGDGAGSSHEFLDMAEYKHGDDITDIDWKATARLNQPVVKRFESTAVLRVIIAADTGAAMAASAADGSQKRLVSAELIRALCWLVSVHGDLVGLVAGNSSAVESMPARSGVAHAETLLRVASSSTVTAPPSDMFAVLRQLEVGSRRSLIFVITDESQINDQTAQLLARLTSRHEVGVFLIDDLDPTVANAELLADVSGGPLPEFIEGNQILESQWRIFRRSRSARVTELLEALPLRYVRLQSVKDVLPALVTVMGGGRRGTRSA